jgi:hypothetical protein
MQVSLLPYCVRGMTTTTTGRIISDDPCTVPRYIYKIYSGARITASILALSILKYDYDVKYDFPSNNYSYYFHP